MCAETCGDGRLDLGEKCDDGHEGIHDGCSNCHVDVGFACAGQPSLCAPIRERAAPPTHEPCQERYVTPGQTRPVGADTSDSPERGRPGQRCGDGVVDEEERCDDGNDVDHNGCTDYHIDDTLR